jgi:hypothetical protein
MKVHLVALLAVFALTGCAAANHNALASRFIRQGARLWTSEDHGWLLGCWRRPRLRGNR